MDEKHLSLCLNSFIFADFFFVFANLEISSETLEKDTWRWQKSKKVKAVFFMYSHLDIELCDFSFFWAVKCAIHNLNASN